MLATIRSAHLILSRLQDVFIAAAERDIYTGDAVQIQIITKDGIEVQTFPLRRD